MPHAADVARPGEAVTLRRSSGATVVLKRGAGPGDVGSFKLEGAA